MTIIHGIGGGKTTTRAFYQTSAAQLPGISTLDTSLYSRKTGATALVTAAGFWTAFAASWGTAVDSNFDSDTYKTLLDVTGSGLLAGCIGPSAGGAESTTIKVTVDGTETTKATAVANVSRVCFGNWLGRGTEYTTANNWTDALYDLDADKDALTLLAYPTTGGTFYYPIPWPALFMRPMIKFDTSLKVEMKHSTAITGTGSNERQSGVVHFKFS